MLSFLWRVPDTAAADSLFAEAYACIDQGLCYDEVNDNKNALIMYQRGFELIKEGEKMKNSKKSELYKLLMEAKKSVENRTKSLEASEPKSKQEIVEKPPVAECKQVDVDKDAIRSQLNTFGEQDAELVYFLPEGVQLFTIDGDQTAAPTPPTSLQIFRFASCEGDTEMTDASAFIQVGPWVYPLMKDRTPILRNEFGAYVVPNPTVEKPNMMVAILLPSDLEPKLIDELHQVFRQFADLREQNISQELTKEEKSQLSKRVAQFLISTGQQIAWGVETTAVKVVSQVEDRGEKYRSSLEQTDKPMTVSPVVKGSIVYVHKGAKVVAKCTRYLLDKVGDMGVMVGKKLAEGAQNSMGDGRAGSFVSGTISIIGGGITGVSTVWIALEDGSKTLCRSIANQTVKNVQIRYGDDASETTHHALYAAGHGSLAAVQLWDLGPRSIAGRVARKAGLQVITDLHGNKMIKETAGPLPEKKKKL